MLNGKLIIDELLIILFVFTLSLFPVEARTTSGNGQKVLVISSYSPIKEEGNHLIASFIDQMQVDSEAKIFVESARGHGNGHIEIDEKKAKLLDGIMII